MNNSKIIEAPIPGFDSTKQESESLTQPLVNAQPQEAQDSHNMQENQRLLEEMASLTAQLKDAKLKAAVAPAKQSAANVKIGAGSQGVDRDRAIRLAGGNSYWYSMTIDQRLSALGVSADGVSDAELKQYFGPTSNAAESNALAKQHPEKYRRLRVIAKEKGIF